MQKCLLTRRLPAQSQAYQKFLGNTKRVINHDIARWVLHVIPARTPRPLTRRILLDLWLTDRTCRTRRQPGGSQAARSTEGRSRTAVLRSSRPVDTVIPGDKRVWVRGRRPVRAGCWIGVQTLDTNPHGEPGQRTRYWLNLRTARGVCRS